MGSHNVGDLFRSVTFFDSLPDTLLWHLAKAGEQKIFGADELVFCEGDARDAVPMTLGQEFIAHPGI